MTRQALMAKKAHLTDAIKETRKELDSLLEEFTEIVKQLENYEHFSTRHE